MELLRGELPNGGARVAPNERPSLASSKLPLQQDEVLVGESEIATGSGTLPFGEARVDGTMSNNAPIVAEGMPSRLRRTREDGEKASKQIERESSGTAILELDDLTDLVVVSVMAEEPTKAKTEPRTYRRLQRCYPGCWNTFDLADVKAMATPGITMFLRIPGPRDPLSAYDDMLSVAKDTAKTLGGELRDEHMSLMTSQVIDHYRQQIIEFARKKMSVRA